ncbi:MAG: inositol monophosphatase [Clostridiales bacterium]|nr:inositol monophosphatase [Clostridiales bacterium]
MIKLIIELAKEVGAYQMAHFKKHDYQVRSKTTNIDMVTEIDIHSEKMIIEWIQKNYPEHRIISEEAGRIEKNSEYTWIIDPLDGTTNYSKGIPVFAVSIALHKNDERFLGVVYVPYFKDVYHAVKGEGAFLNGSRIGNNSIADLSNSVVASGFPYDRKTAVDNNVNYAAKVIPQVKGFRRMGAAAYDLCLIAEGSFDGYWEMGLKPWDVEAGLLIITEAGGYYKYINNIRGKKILIAGNEKIIRELEEILMSD